MEADRRARNLVALGRFDEAEPLLLRAYEAFIETLGESHARTARCREALHELYISTGQPDEARRFEQ